MEVHKDWILLDGSTFAAMLQDTQVNFLENVVLCPSFLLEKNTKQLDFTT